MTITPYNEALVSETITVRGTEQQSETPIWEEISSWLVLLPTLFITVSGSIQTESAPIAFRFTAMEEDSLGRRLTRLACLLLIVVLMSTRFREILSVCKSSKLLLLLPALAIASMFWSQSPVHTLVNALNLLLTTLFAVYLFLRYPGGRIVSFLNFAAFVSLVLCAIAVAAFPSIGVDAFQQDAWRGIFGQRNNCAAACTLFLVVGLHCKNNGIIEQIMSVSVTFLSLVFIVMSGSRTGYILAALAVTLTYMLRFVAKIRSLDRVFFLMILVIPVTLAGLFISSNFTELLAAMDKDPTLTQRTIIWAQVIPSIIKHPLLGYGYSAFWAGLNGESSQAVLTTRWMEGQAQDGYLDILLQLGLVGLIPVVLVFLRGFVHATSFIERKILTPATMLAIVMVPLILLENIGESSLLLPLGIPWLYALLALVTLAFPERQAESF